MNPEQLLDQAAVAIQNTNASNSHTFVVGFKRGSIVCIPAYQSTLLEIVFARYSAATIIHGLTPSQWDQLSNRIANFYFQKGLL